MLVIHAPTPRDERAVTRRARIWGIRFVCSGVKFRASAERGRKNVVVQRPPSALAALATRHVHVTTGGGTRGTGQTAQQRVGCCPRRRRLLSASPAGRGRAQHGHTHCRGTRPRASQAHHGGLWYAHRATGDAHCRGNVAHDNRVAECPAAQLRAEATTWRQRALMQQGDGHSRKPASPAELQQQSSCTSTRPLRTRPGKWAQSPALQRKHQRRGRT